MVSLPWHHGIMVHIKVQHSSFVERRAYTLSALHYSLPSELITRTANDAIVDKHYIHDLGLPVPVNHITGHVASN